MRTSLKILLLSGSLTLSCIVISCADLTEKQTKASKKEETAKPHLVGRVASIPADRKFVLIQSYGNWSIATGAILATLGPDGRAANLRVTGEKLGQFAAADVQSGSLEIGDGVYTTITPPETTENSGSETTPEEITGALPDAFLR